MEKSGAVAFSMLKIVHMMEEYWMRFVNQFSNKGSAPG